MTGYIKKSDAYRVTLHKAGDAAKAAIEELPNADVIPVSFIMDYVDNKLFDPVAQALVLSVVYDWRRKQTELEHK